MEKKISKSKLPCTDSIRELAAFWDEHDLTDFEGDLEKVTAPVFVRDKSIHLQLKPRESKQIQRIAESTGVSQDELIHQWIVRELGRRKRNGRASA